MKYIIIAEYSNGARIVAYATNSIVIAFARFVLLARRRNGYRLIIEGAYNA